MPEFLSVATLPSRDLALNLWQTFKKDAFSWMKRQPENTLMHQTASILFDSFTNVTMIISGYIELKLAGALDWDTHLKYEYPDVVERFTRWFSVISDLSNYIKKTDLVDAQRIIDACDSIGEGSNANVIRLRKLALAEIAGGSRLRAHELSSANDAYMANQATDKDGE